MSNPSQANPITEERRNIQRAQRLLGMHADGIFTEKMLMVLQSRLLGAAAAVPPANVIAFPVNAMRGREWGCDGGVAATEEDDT